MTDTRRAPSEPITQSAPFRAAARFLAAGGLLGLASAIVPSDARAQSRAECEDGVREIRTAIGEAAEPSLREELAELLREAERELGEEEYDECMMAVEDARRAMEGSPAAAARARAPAEHLQADDGLPVTIEDAFVPRRGEAEATLSFAYDRVRRGEAEDDEDDGDEGGGRSGRHLFEGEAELEIGLGAGFAVTIGASYVLGDAEDTKSGELELGGKWNFLPQHEFLPALTVAASVALPYGFENDTTETSLGLLASKALWRGPDSPWLHANLFWIHAFNRDDDARANRFSAVLGYTHPLGPSTALVADLVHEKDEDKGRIINLVELGLRHALPGDIILGIGVGAGFGGSTTDFRALLGIQKEF
ncbi:MAG: hypothetical protein IRZ04_14915 [Rhodospirillales bacterium]|nr:hypothetical protein [Rhodospirillales bacterium]